MVRVQDLFDYRRREAAATAPLTRAAMCRAFARMAAS